MAGWHRRAQEAEAKLKAAPTPSGKASAALERENRELRERWTAARLRTKQLKAGFLRQQQEKEAHQ